MAQLLSVSLQNGLRFVHLLLPASPSACFTTGFPLWESYGFTMFRFYANERVRCLLVRRWLFSLRAGKGEPYAPKPLTFWFKPISIFGLLVLTTFIAVHICYPYRSILAPVPPDAGSRHLASQFNDHSYECGYIVPRAIAKMDYSFLHVLVGYQQQNTGSHCGSHMRQAYKRPHVAIP